jgi:hypothetical protein
MKALLRYFARATAARHPSLDRVQARLAPELCDEGTIRATLAAAPRARPGAEARVWDRTLQSLHEARPRTGWPRSRRLVLVAGTTVGLAAGLAIGLLAPTVTRVTGEAVDRGLAGVLSAEDWNVKQPTSLVSLAYKGEGTLTGTERVPVIEWRSGTLRVEVEPGRGIRLRVRTAEGRIDVMGTGFTVVRDAMGTSVSVSHGRVAVACDDGTSFPLDMDETGTCLPTSPAALLGRALALVESGAPPDVVLASVDRGVAAGPAGAILAELEVVRMQVLAGSGRWDEAYAAAGRWLAGGAPERRTDVLHLSARYAMQAGGCAEARPVLEALRSGGLAASPELVQLADCAGARDPGLAREALVEALRLGVPGDQQDAVVERLVRLGESR